MVKPDGVARGLVGEIVSRIERRGLSIRAMRLLWVSPEQAADHYAEHSEKSFYPGLAEFITSGPVVAMVIEGDSAVSTVRGMMGATNPLDSAPGTIRGDYALVLSENIVHGSDSPESAARELPLYFASGELLPAGE